MTSNINPNLIDGNYPVAGQDNSTQGMRDNFTNTKVNFQFAANEITSLQNQALLKNSVNNLLDALLINGIIQDFGLVRYIHPTTSGTITINYASGHYHIIGPTTGNITLAFANFPQAGVYGVVKVSLEIDSVSHTLTLPSVVTLENSDGITGYDPGSRTFTFPSAGVYEFVFSSYDNGNTLTIDQGNMVLQPFSNSSEELDNGDAASIAITASYFATGVGAETATLTDGVEGSIKTFMMSADGGGNMVITVTNAGWKTSGNGTMTFDTIGDACTLQYVNGRWYCVGNNGVSFA